MEAIALTPSEIVAELDKYIIGQQQAKRYVAIALRNRWRRMQVPAEFRKEIVPNNILMIGATGVGKTEIARRLAQLTQAPFVKVEASKFTEVGYVGRDVESMIRDLVEQSVNLVKAERIIQVRAKARENAEEVLLDLLIPPVDVPEIPEGESDSSEIQEAALNQRTRNKFREKLSKGELEERMVEIETTASSHQVQVMGPMGMEGMEGLQDMISNMVPKKKKILKMTVADAREYLIDEEAQRLIDMDAVTRDALERAENNGIVFIDEIDKVATGGGGKSGGPDVSREGVQRDLLPIVEGSVVNTKYGSVKTDHMLFIAAGAFHVAKPSDLIPELQGRFPIRVELDNLTENDFFRILTEPKNALTRQYEEMLRSEGVNLTFSEDSIRSMAAIACQVNEDIENIGARRLHTILSTVLSDLLFEVPDISEVRDFEVSSKYVEGKLSAVLSKKDLSRYIL
jgi:ATP-dependent HslUV protease ATP-binding subunit HslU